LKNLINYAHCILHFIFEITRIHETLSTLSKQLA